MANSRKEYIEAAKAAFLNLAKKQVIQSLTKQFIFLSWGPIAPLFAMLVEKILVEAVQGTETGIFFMYVDFRVDAQAKTFSEAAIENYRVQQNGTEEEKYAAEEKLIKAFDDFVKFNRI